MYTDQGIQYDSIQKKKLIKVIKPDIQSLLVARSVESIVAGSITNSAFYLCKNNIKTVSFEEGSMLNSIGEHLFEQTSVTSVDFSHCTHLKVITKSAFQACESLQNVILPPNLQKLLGGSFSYAKPINKIVIPDSLEEMIYDPLGVFAYSTISAVEISENSLLRKIDHHTFTGTKLTSFYFGKSVSTLGSSVFSLSTVSKFTVNPNNTFISTDGITLYDKEKTKIITVVPIHSGEYRILDSVNRLEDQALRYSTFTNVIFPNHKVELGSIAFGQTHFQTIDISNGTEEISGSCFSYSKLKNITLPNSIKTISTQAFEYCTNLENIVFSTSLLTIANRAFFGCISLTDITIPFSVTTFGSSVFTKCSSNLNVTFENTNKFSIVDNMVIADGTRLVEYFGTDPNDEITMPECVTNIPDQIFNGASLKTISFANSKSMKFGKYSFYYSTIKTMNFPACLSSIGVNCFEGCKVQTIICDGTLTTIPLKCFCDCTSLESFTIKCSTITTIGSQAFFMTTKLTSIDFGSNPLNIIDQKCFSYSALNKVTIPQTITEVRDYAFSHSSITTITFLNTMNLLSKYCLSECTSLESIIFSNIITTLDIYSVSYCTKLTSVSLSPGTATINSYAFCQCTSLSCISIPEGSLLNRIYPFAFEGCNILTEFDIQATDRFAFDEGCLMNKDKTDLIFFLPTTNKKFFVVPAKVTTISDFAFQSCNSLREIIIPDGVITKIGVNAFENCTKLTRVILPKSLQTIGKDAFTNCISIKCGSIFMSNNETLIAQAKEADIKEEFVSEYCLNNYSLDNQRITCNYQRRTPFNLSLIFLLTAFYSA